MKATLSFDLSDPDDRKRHLQCVKSQDMAICLHRIHEIMFKADEDYPITTFAHINDALEHINLEELT